MWRRILFLLIVGLFGWAVPASGQYFDWGQSPSGIRWNQTETPLGKIVYPDYFAKGAGQVDHYLRAIHPTLGYGFKYDPIRVPIVLHTQSFEANGIVMWAPKRMELRAVPSTSLYATPWLKQLAAHESRHALQQYGNLYRGGFMKTLGVIFGQHAGLFGTVLIPFWLLEGDAVQAETQAFEFGRALQPSFTLEYRAYFAEGRKFHLDKWFCGSFRDFIPDHYQYGYQLTAWGREKHGDDIWGRVAEYGSRNPVISVFSINPALRKYYKTSVREIARNTMADLTEYWNSLPQEEDSGEIIPTPIQSYTVYDTPLPVNDSTVIVLKRDFTQANRFVQVNTHTGTEKHLFYTGSVATPPTLRNGMIYWSEYRSSTFWEERVFSRACSYDLQTGKRHTYNDRTNALYPTPLPGGQLATIGYDYKGEYFLELNEGKTIPIADSLSVHGLAFDDRTGTLAFIGLSDAGMAFYTIDPTAGTVIPLTLPSRSTVYNLRAGDGKLAYNSIASGKDEIHLYDLQENQEYKLTTSRFGSFSPSAPDSTDNYYFTTYSSKGYLLARQESEPASLTKLEPARLPKNSVNPPRSKWDVVLLDTVKSPTALAADKPVKRYRKGGHLFNLHSWTPWSFNPFNVAEENKIDVNLGATVMSQNLLSSTSGYLSYGYANGTGHRLRGLINFYGLAPKFQIGADYGGGKQSVYGQVPETTEIPTRKNHLQLHAQVSLPMMLSSGHRLRSLTPSISFLHMNAMLYNADNNTFSKGYQRMVTSLSFVDQVRTATRDIRPRWGYAFKFTMVGTPFSDKFGNLVSLYARALTPGIVRHHSLMLRGNLQYQNRETYNFSYKELAPRGAYYNFAVFRYGVLSADYQFPVCYPDWGINGLVYFKRIRMNLYYDFARMERNVTRENAVVKTMQNLTSYGGEIIFDMHPLRIPNNITIIGVYLYKPNDRKGVMMGVNLTLPL